MPADFYFGVNTLYGKVCFEIRGLYMLCQIRDLLVYLGMPMYLTVNLGFADASFVITVNWKISYVFLLGFNPGTGILIKNSIYTLSMFFIFCFLHCIIALSQLLGKKLRDGCCLNSWSQHNQKRLLQYKSFDYVLMCLIHV